MSRVNEWHWTEMSRERSQIAAINELDQQLSRERATQHRRLRTAKAEFQTGLDRVDSKLSSVADRVDRVLEWTELRFQLLEFDEYEARKAVRKPFRALAEGHPVPALEIEDVTGYWLPPAASAFLPLILREAPSAATNRHAVPFADLQTGLETARGRDPIRSELFNLAAALCFDQPAFVDAAVLRLLGADPDLGLAEPGQVAEAWRTLWIHAARGAFGSSAAALLNEQLAARFDPDALDDDELAAWDRAIGNFGGVDSAPLAVEDAFARLGEHLAAEPPRTDPAPAADDQLWRLYLEELIEEPSPVELPLVTAMEELHHSQAQGRRSAPTWSEPEGTVAELLREDLFAPNGGPALRALALGMAAPLLRSRVEVLAETASRPEPVTRVVKRMGAKIMVDRDGHAPEDFEEAKERIERAAEYTGSTNTLAHAAIGLGAAAALSALVQVWFLAVLFALGAMVPLWRRRRFAAERQVAAERAEIRVSELRAELDRARRLVRESEAERDERTEALTRSRDELLEVLRRF